ncbi:hypothetical protein EV424DRAFT_1374608 [Suillus variegatus]|nr:hypothetical protein EV424DRAFT_1430954 [Suillus variegatus]KAG1830817.1 hypothetical protein EV424DRAFT_1374608 [Suillus variegatus]
MSEASFRLRQALLTPRQVLPNIFAVSVLISTSTLYAASRPRQLSVPRHHLHMPRQTSPPQLSHCPYNLGIFYFTSVIIIDILTVFLFILTL